MNTVLDMKDFIGTSQGDKAHMLGKFLYFSLSSLLIDREALKKLCEDTGIPYAGGTRLSVGDAFRSATGDIRERIPVTSMGETNIYLAYCRDNKHTNDVLSRELVKVTTKGTAFSAVTTLCRMPPWMCGAAAAGRRSCSSSTRSAPTVSRWRPSV